MKPLTKSDLANIEAYKQLLTMLNNDIENAKTGLNTPQEKAHLVFNLSQQRSDLIQSAKKNYPAINWVLEAINSKSDVKKFKDKVIFKLNLN
jgi:hypothetical protein